MQQPAQKLDSEMASADSSPASALLAEAPGTGGLSAQTLGESQNGSQIMHCAKVAAVSLSPVAKATPPHCLTTSLLAQ